MCEADFLVLVLWHRRQCLFIHQLEWRTTVQKAPAPNIKKYHSFREENYGLYSLTNFPQHGTYCQWAARIRVLCKDLVQLSIQLWVTLNWSPSPSLLQFSGFLYEDGGACLLQRQMRLCGAKHSTISQAPKFITWKIVEPSEAWGKAWGQGQPPHLPAYIRHCIQPWVCWGKDRIKMCYCLCIICTPLLKLEYFRIK